MTKLVDYTKLYYVGKLFQKVYILYNHINSIGGERREGKMKHFSDFLNPLKSPIFQVRQSQNEIPGQNNP